MNKLILMTGVATILTLGTISESWAESWNCGPKKNGEYSNSVICNYDEESKTLIIEGEGNMGDYAYTWPISETTPWTSKEIVHAVIKGNVTSIGDRAFSGASSLTSITIPDSVTSIGTYAFKGATGLKSITIPEGVTSIEEGAFLDATGLTSITIPDSVKSIGDNAFAYTGLTSITIPDDIGTENWRADVFYGLPEKTKIVCQGDVNTCYEKLAKYFKNSDCPQNLKNVCNCKSYCIKKEIQPAQSSEQCNGSYIYENGNCHKRNEEQCNATGKYYYNGATCLYRPRNRQVTCVNPNYKANDGYCDRIRYTPAEAAEVLRNDNTNSVTITFKK